MASSGSFSTSAYSASDGTRNLTFSWEQTSQSTSANTTTISWKLYGGGTSTQWIAVRNVKLVIAGATVYTYGGDYNNNLRVDQGDVIASGSYTFTHNADGTKSFTASAEAAIYTLAVNCTGSQTFTLNTIARASQPSLVTWPESTQNVGNFGETFSIHMNRKSDSFTHTVRYEYGNRSGTIATNVGTGTTWAVPLEFMNDIPNATSASGRIYVDTISNGSTVGTKYTGFTVTVPASVKPSCSIALDDTTGADDIYGSPVKGLSKIKVTVSATQAYSSPIDSYTISVNGETFKTSTGTTGVLTKSGSVPVNVTVKDKRGRTGTASYTMNVQDYTAPAVTMLTVKRCNADGTENAEGEYCQLTFNATISSMNSKNTASYTCGYKQSTSGSWTNLALSSLNNIYSLSNAKYTFKADSNISYDVKVTATDRHATATRTTSVSTAFTILNFHESGTGMGIGKVAEKANALEVGITADFQKPVRGRAYGLSELPGISEGEDFNTYTTPGCYAVYSNSTTTGIANMPVKSAGRLYVSVANGAAENSTYAYREQKFVPVDYSYSGGGNAWIRMIQKAPDSDWVAHPWFNEALKAYPIGSIYIAYNHDNPATLFGGVWQRIENRFLWATTASGTIGLVSGASEVTLTEAQLPAHSHGSVYSQHASGTKSQAWYTTAGTSLAYGTVSTGGGEAHNNMPPYIQVSIWRRTG